MKPPTAAQLREYIEAADAELGPACCDAWVEWCRQTLVDAWVAQAGCPLPEPEPKPRSDPPGVLFGPWEWQKPREGLRFIAAGCGGPGGPPTPVDIARDADGKPFRVWREGFAALFARWFGRHE